MIIFQTLKNSKTKSNSKQEVLEAENCDQSEQDYKSKF